jgi:hypothetical protein
MNKTETLSDPFFGYIKAIDSRRCEALCGAISKTRDQLRSVLEVDALHRHGHEPPQLQQALGAWGGRALDLTALSEVLTHRRPAPMLDAVRRGRIEGLVETLDGLEGEWRPAARTVAMIDLSEGREAVQNWAEAHFNRLAALCRALRLAQLEIRSRYDAARHDAVFAAFSWRDLSPAELRLGPPVVVHLAVDTETEATLAPLVSLLESGLPLKVLALRSSFAPHPVSPRLCLETLPFTLRQLYLLQTTTVAPDLEERFAASLDSPRAALISCFMPSAGESEAAFVARADRAVRSRAFPAIVFDPDRDAGFVGGFDLSGNPEPESLWPVEGIEFRNRNAVLESGEQMLTPASFALGEAAFASEFSEPPSNVELESLTPLEHYLQFTSAQRVGKLPFVGKVDRDQVHRRVIVSPVLVRYVAARAELWTTLCELGGIQNPYLRAQEKALKATFALEQKEREIELRAKVEAECHQREQAALAVAVRGLVSELTGVDPGPIQPV